MPRRMKSKRNRAPQRFIGNTKSPRRRLLRVIRAKRRGDSNPAKKLRLVHVWTGPRPKGPPRQQPFYVGATAGDQATLTLEGDGTGRHRGFSPRRRLLPQIFSGLRRLVSPRAQARAERP